MHIFNVERIRISSSNFTGLIQIVNGFEVPSFYMAALISHYYLSMHTFADIQSFGSSLHGPHLPHAHFMHSKFEIPNSIKTVKSLMNYFD